MIALNTALDELRVVELRFFLGCTNEEAAEVLGVSRVTIGRDLEFRLTGLTSEPAATNEADARHSQAHEHE